jgi:hypothetical protein
MACNGCTDDTAAIARQSGYNVKVIEIGTPSKAAALRAGDVTAMALPRLYLDADVVLPGASALRVLRRLMEGAVAARPPIRYETHRASAPVRSYYRARTRMPAVMQSLWGAGVMGLSAQARSRFAEFPDLVADDLWLDGLFTREEIEIVDCDPVAVTTPLRTRDLMRVLRRTYRGKAENRATPDGAVKATTPSALRDLGRLLAAGPASTVDAATYAAFATGARIALAGGRGTPVRWERDESSRAA